MTALAGDIQTVNEIARDYMHLVLALGQHDPHLVDAYYGPEDLRAEAESSDLSPQAIEQRSVQLLQALGRIPEPDGDLDKRRITYLAKQLVALQTRAAMVQGQSLRFEQECRRLYDAQPPQYDATHFQSKINALERLLPGQGDITQRLTRFKSDFTIPRDRLGKVFDAAIEECRNRTRSHIELPDGESFHVEYVTDQPWSAYNWYQGNYKSLIQVNVDLPIAIDRAIDLACHEGYPGHHVYNLLIEANLVNRLGWVEFSVYPLFSPQSLIAEGSANYGIDVTFPGDERLIFERDSLFPLAGLDPARAETYHRVLKLVHDLSYAGNEAARHYLDQNWDRDKAVTWLQTYALMDPARAQQRLKFIERYRSYVINYNYGQDLVAAHIDRRLKRDPTRSRWDLFTELLAAPHVPSELTSASQ